MKVMTSLADGVTIVITFPKMKKVVKENAEIYEKENSHKSLKKREKKIIITKDSPPVFQKKYIYIYMFSLWVQSQDTEKETLVEICGGWCIILICFSLSIFRYSFLMGSCFFLWSKCGAFFRLQREGDRESVIDDGVGKAETSMHTHVYISSWSSGW